jgi:hypothetical protein
LILSKSKFAKPEDRPVRIETFYKIFEMAAPRGLKRKAAQISDESEVAAHDSVELQNIEEFGLVAPDWDDEDDEVEAESEPVPDEDEDEDGEPAAEYDDETSNVQKAGSQGREIVLRRNVLLWEGWYTRSGDSSLTILNNLQRQVRNAMRPFPPDGCRPLRAIA